MKTLSSSNPVKDAVWERMAKEHPEFTRAHDIADNYHTVQEIVLGGSLTWAGANERFKPFPGALVMDIGANAGIYTAYCALHGAIVEAYEPHPDAFRLMTEMLSNTGLRYRVKPNIRAIWVHTGFVPYTFHNTFGDNCKWFNGSLPAIGIGVKEFEHAHEIQCVSLDDAIADLDFDCVKMDIEGAEFQVILATRQTTLEHIKFMYVEFHPWAPQNLYDATIQRLEKIFHFEGTFPNKLGRWEAGYCTKR